MKYVIWLDSDTQGFVTELGRRQSETTLRLENALRFSALKDAIAASNHLARIGGVTILAVLT